ncbi:hypothetical protein TWF694_002269 [Orbilia ellipsospora]|uniref:Major facilitator superfamily (MFS) profile domain-containing protein n=1 Tax=Orbilia ellipsospora TaxID=2528407 RepID=A0AAV9X1G5_9PEZI
MDERDERTPLLRQQATNTTTTTTRDSDRDVLVDTETAGQSAANSPRKALFIIILFIIILFVFDFADSMFQAPIVRIYEDIICRNYFDAHQPELNHSGRQIPEEQCKIPPVQKELALIRGMEPVFDAIPSLLVAIPLGMIADNPKIGRKPVIVIALLGSLLQVLWVTIVTRFSDLFPLRCVWLGSLFLLGGGTNIINGLLYTMIIDITAPAERASTFFTLQMAGSWLPVLVAPPITTSLMENTGNWVPVSIGLMLSFIGLIILLFVPETINFHKPSPASSNHESILQSPTTSESTVDESSLPTSEKFWPTLKSKLYEFVESSSFVFRSPHLIILICSLMMHTICVIRGKETVLYYASARYGITIAKANLLNTINAAVSIAILFFLPFISTFLTSSIGVSSQRKDLLIAQASVTLIAIGWYAVGLAPTLPLAILGMVGYTLGSGFSGSMRSLAASYVESHHQARLSSFIAIMMTVGNFLGSPMLAWLYSLGISSGDPHWYGLPFIGLGVVFTIIWSALCFVVKLPESSESAILDENASEY